MLLYLHIRRIDNVCTEGGGDGGRAQGDQLLPKNRAQGAGDCGEYEWSYGEPLFQLSIVWFSFSLSISDTRSVPLQSAADSNECETCKSEGISDSDGTFFQVDLMSMSFSVS